VSPPQVPPRRPADNPFASHRVEALPYRHRGSSLADLERRLTALGGRAAVVGPKGSGKTTLTGELATRCNGNAVHVAIPAACPHPWRVVREQLPRRLSRGRAVFVDGAEQLGPVGWRRLLLATRHATSLVVTLHLPGRLPTLTECRTDPALLRELVRELAPDDAPLIEPHLDELHRRHRGNLRECFRELYDLFAGRARDASFEF
jgi:hypothetical protein